MRDTRHATDGVENVTVRVWVRTADQKTINKGKKSQTITEVKARANRNWKSKEEKRRIILGVRGIPRVHVCSHHLRYKGRSLPRTPNPSTHQTTLQSAHAFTLPGGTRGTVHFPVVRSHPVRSITQGLRVHKVISPSNLPER